MKHVVIIGNGVSGITAARHIRKLRDYRISVISSETPYFFSRTALMYVYMGHLTFENTKPYEDRFWKKNRIDLLLDRAEQIDTGKKIIRLGSGKALEYDVLVLATGSQSNFTGVPGEELRGVQGLYSIQDLQKMEANTHGIGEAVIVGGGLIGVEMAEMLRSRNIGVTMLVREPAFWSNVLPIQEASMISRHIISHGVHLRHGAELKEILPGPRGKVNAILTKTGERIPCDFVGITIGVRPNTAWLQESGIDVDRGVLVNEYLETNIPDVYAVGDCVERRSPLPGRKSIEQVWYTARMMGEKVAQTICGERTGYTPGPWFNSAKFFDIEFQTYGHIGNSLQQEQGELYWEHGSGRKAMHVVWNKNTNAFEGINSFGIRLRHENFDRWLREERTVQYIIDRLHEANFDPEFSDHHEHEIRRLFYSSVRAIAGDQD